MDKKYILILFVFSLFIISGCTSCPESCDDGKKCTNDFCSKETNFECINEPIQCDDNNKCTVDSCSEETGQCTYNEITPCCGNGIIEDGETCSNCLEDVKCEDGKLCCNEECISPVCKSDIDCNDKKSYTDDSCLNKETCNAKCDYVYTTQCKTDGYCPDNCNIENDADCIGKALENTKYSISDVDEVKELAKKCKFDINICAEDYKAKTIPVEVYSMSLYGQDIYTDEQMTIWVWTPFFRAVKEISEKEKKYEEYTDLDIIDYLAQNEIHIYLTYGNKLNTKIKDMGYFETVILKDGSTIFNSESSSYMTFDSSIKIRKIPRYNEFKDKTIKLVIVGGTGEKEVSINMMQFK
jgi:hypothetical protein